jgi:hypothetical protein
VRRGDREIGDRDRIDDIIRRCPVCHLGLVSDGEPYVVPLSFGYDGDSVYLHMAAAGRKLDALRTGARACIEWDIQGEVLTAEQACGWGTRYESVIGWGRPEILVDPDEKRTALDLIMGHTAGERPPGAWQYDESTLALTVVVRIPLDRITGKARD